MKPPRSIRRRHNHATPAGKENTRVSTTAAPRRNKFVSQPINGTKSCDALATKADVGAPIPPRIPGRLSSKFAKPFLHKRIVSEKQDMLDDRPASAPARIIKTRNSSMEQLKALWTHGRAGSQQSTMKPSVQPQHPEPQDPPSHKPPDNLEKNMKNQMFHFLKTDRVVEAWENMAKKTNYGQNTAKSRKTCPCSIFRAKLSRRPRARPERETRLARTHAELEKQMSWTQESPEYLNTYSFKQRSEASPRIHVMSVQLNIDEDKNVAKEGESKTPKANDGTISAVTALPALPPSTPTTIRSMVTLYKPRTIGSIQGQ